MDNPRASLAILKVLEKYLRLKDIDYTPLLAAERLFEEEIERILDFIKKPLELEDLEDPITFDDIEQIKSTLAEQTHVPDSARKQIEELFRKAGHDPAVAVELKKKLDEWHVYDVYEDRFLAIFRKVNEDHIK